MEIRGRRKIFVLFAAFSLLKLIEGSEIIGTTVSSTFTRHGKFFVLIVNKNHNLLVHKIFNQSRKDKELHKFINYLIKNGSKDKGMRMTAHILE